VAEIRVAVVGVASQGGRVDLDDVLGACADGLVVQDPLVRASQDEQQGAEVLFRVHVGTLEQDQVQLWFASLEVAAYADYGEAALDVEVAYRDVQEIQVAHGVQELEVVHLVGDAGCAQDVLEVHGLGGLGDQVLVHVEDLGVVEEVGGEQSVGMVL